MILYVYEWLLFFSFFLLPTGLSPEKDVYFLLDPILVIGRIGVRALLVDETGEIRQLIDKVEQLTDVVRDGRDVGVLAFQMFLVDLADALHALIDGLVVGVGPGLGLLARLDEEDCVGHLEKEKKSVKLYLDTKQICPKRLCQYHARTRGFSEGLSRLKWKLNSM